MKKIFCICLVTLSISLQINAKSGYERHIVKKGETLFSISHAHGLKVGDLIRANPSLKANTNIRIGQEINIPSKSYSPQNRSSDVKGSSLEGPAQTHNAHYKPVSVSSTPDVAYSDEDIQSRKPSENAINATASISNDNPVVAKPKESAENANCFSVNAGAMTPDKYSTLFNQYTEHGYKIAENKGTANYLVDNTEGNPYLALYNDAEPGSVIRVTNIMNQRFVYLKVVGKVSRLDASKEIVIKLSEKTAEELGAQGEKFLVSVEGIAHK